MLVADQLREDLLDKYGDLFTGGFKRLVADGHRYVNATHDHAVTETAPGHATILLPSREHGPVRLPEPPGNATTCQAALDALATRFATEETS